MIDIFEYAPDHERFVAIRDRAVAQDKEVRPRVETILERVRQEGDAGLVALTREIDGVALTPQTLRVDEAELQAAQDEVSEDFLTAMALARVNIRRFHEYQRRAGYVHDDGDNVRLSKRVLPIKRVGVYVPGGTAPLFSTMLMNVIPAQIAGVEEIYAVTPPRKDGTVDPHILATAHVLGIDGVFRVGGAHGIAALAYGTGAVPKVDKIVGPGGPYVAMAKRLVFGLVGIDAVAGPSEIVIVADGSAKPRYIAADLLSQLEHGSGYEAGVVLTDSRDIAAAVKIELERQAGSLERFEAIERSMQRFGAVFLCRDLSEAMDAANAIAPEHLEILAVNARDYLGEVENAGAVFLGHASPEPVGDYFAGTNHVLPTGGAARFSSSLSVYDFLKDISVVEYSAERLVRVGRHILCMAEIEGLAAHANAVKVRLEDLTS